MGRRGTQKVHRSSVARAGVLLAGVLFLAGATGAPGAETNKCDRECLQGLMDGYLAALLAHDPSRLSTAPKVRFTENTNRMALGDGLWQTVDGLGTYKLYIEDPSSGQVAFYGTVKENGLTALLGVRLRVQGRRLSEIETMVVRQATGIHGAFDELKSAEPFWEQAVPPGSRASREQLIHAADQYFNGIEKGTGDIVPFADDTVRIENGAQTAPTPATATHPAISAREAFDSKRFNYIHEVTHRRFLVVDPERGLVVAFAMFQHPGNIKVPPPPTGARPQPFALSSYPNTTQIMETFQVRDGKIRHIFAYIALVPYRQQPGW
jgi:hypothetical protein